MTFNFFKNFYKGRISSTQYLKARFLLMILLIIIIILGIVLGQKDGRIAVGMIVAGMVLFIIFDQSISVRRQHDLGKNGRNNIFLFSFLNNLEDGVDAENEYGPPPKKRNVFKVILNKD